MSEEQRLFTAENIKNARQLIRLVAARQRAMPNVNQPTFGRRDMGIETSYEGARDYMTVFGRKEQLDWSNYLAMYERGGIAGQVIDVRADDTWGEPPEITEDGRNDTEFVEAWQELANKHHVWDVLRRADALSGIGEYGILMFGLAGEEEQAEQVRKGQYKGAEGLLWLRPFHQGDAEIVAFDESATSERCGYPTVYSVNLSGPDKGATKVHYTRVLHLTEFRTNSEVYGRPWLARAYDTLEDVIHKILGGSAESSWLNMRKPTLMTTQTGYDFDTDDATNMDNLTDQLEALVHDLGRFLVAPGWNVQEIASAQVWDPRSAFDVHLDHLAGITRMPKHILLGSAAGELSSSESDDRRWAGVIRRRQNTYAGPRVLRLCIDTLIWYGVLPEPAKNYDIGVQDDEGNWNWPSTIQMTAEQEAAIQLRRASAIKQTADAEGRTAATKKEKRVIVGLPAEVPEDMEDDEPEPVKSAAPAQPEQEPEIVEPPEQEPAEARVNESEHPALAMIAANYAAGAISWEQFVVNVQAAAADKGKGPGKGWWGPPKGTHVGKLASSGEIAAFVDPLLDKEARKVVEVQAIIGDALEGIPLDHLEGLELISGTTPQGWVDYGEGWTPRRGEPVGIAGAYSREHKAIIIHPASLARDDDGTSMTLLHELGHHVTRTLQPHPAGVTDYFLTDISDYFGKTKESLGRVGLRPYSLTKPAEFMADAYTVWAKGSQAQWNELNEFVKEFAGEDLEHVFGSKERG